MSNKSIKILELAAGEIGDCLIQDSENMLTSVAKTSITHLNVKA